jgi:hypothetical protein
MSFEKPVESLGTSKVFDKNHQNLSVDILSLSQML